MSKSSALERPLSSENLELKLWQLEQKIVRGEADSDAFENFIIYQLERHKKPLRRLAKSK